MERFMSEDLNDTNKVDAGKMTQEEAIKCIEEVTREMPIKLSLHKLILMSFMKINNNP